MAIFADFQANFISKLLNLSRIFFWQYVIPKLDHFSRNISGNFQENLFRKHEAFFKAFMLFLENWIHERGQLSKEIPSDFCHRKFIFLQTISGNFRDLDFKKILVPKTSPLFQRILDIFQMKEFF